jgi:hypothetical protein
MVQGPSLDDRIYLKRCVSDPFTEFRARTKVPGNEGIWDLYSPHGAGESSDERSCATDDLFCD